MSGLVGFTCLRHFGLPIHVTPELDAVGVHGWVIFGDEIFVAPSFAKRMQRKARRRLARKDSRRRSKAVPLPSLGDAIVVLSEARLVRV